MNFSSILNFSRISGAVLIPSVAVIKTDSKTNNKKELVCRPSELPIYCPEPKSTINNVEKEDAWVTNLIEEKVSGFRNIIENVVHEVKAYENVAEEYLKQGIDQADGALSYLRQENNTAPKVGAIAIGGLAGLILSLRKGYFKRLLYTASGAGAMTAVCYPKQSAEYAEMGYLEGKKYATIAYNFAYGVKKGDPPMELPSFPQLPSSVSELWDLIYKKISSLFLDRADSDYVPMCNYLPHTTMFIDGDEKENKDDVPTCHCFDDSEAMQSNVEWS